MRKVNYRKNISASLFILLSFISYSQYECVTADSVEIEPKTQLFCNDPNNKLDNYLLDRLGINKYDQSPKYTVNLKVHIMQYSLSDPRNYTYNDSVKIRELIEEVNNFFSNIKPPTIPVINSTLEETDTRIRFHLDTIDFIQDTVGWEVSTTYSDQINYSFSLIDTNKIVFNGNISPSTLCIEITNSNSNDGIYKIIDHTFSNGSTTLTLGSSFSDINDQSGIAFKISRGFGNNFYNFNKYHKTDSSAIHIYYVRNDDDCYQVGFGQAIGIGSNALIMASPGSSTIQLNYVSPEEVGLLAHELGHCLGLRHTMNLSPDSYITDIFQPDGNLDWKPCNDSTISNNIMGYNTCRTYLSPLQIAEIRRYANNYKVVKNTVLETYSSTNNDVYITEPDVTWEKHEIIGSTLYIESGAKLTIKCKVHFSSDGRVVIKPGGKLIVDGGLLTNDYGDYWQGIQVYGTSDKNQFPESNPTHQGLLIVKNGGVIENAHNAVTNWKEGDFNSIGGVIQVTDGVFRNNRRDVEFISYQNYTPSYSNKYRNLSYFRNTDFISDDDFIEKGLPIQSHVTMWEVDGIVFANCHFSNDITTNKNNSSAPNRGIYSINAGYRVLAGCSTTPPFGQQCPTANLQRSSFKGFMTAIEMSGSATTETVTVQQAVFEDNAWGIKVDDFDNVSLNRNIIDVGGEGYPPLYIPIGVGIMASNSTGYIIEENNIFTNHTGGVHGGVIISNSGTDDNRIYNNKLTDLDIATGGSGLNHNSNYQKGLQFLCNEYTNNSSAIAIGSNSTNDGVRFYQGDFSPLKSAGNSFQNNTLDIDNAANSIVYIHNGGNTEPQTHQGLVTLDYTSNTNYCPSSFSGGIVMRPTQLLIDSLTTELNSYSAAYNDLNFTYQSLIDDGNTEEFKDNIELNWSSDAWLLRSKLLETSPYLSTDALLEAASQNVLPNGMLLEVLLANSDATRGEGFIEKLKEVTHNTFPEYMLDYIRGNYDSKTLRTDMEGQLSVIHSDLSNTRNWIKYYTKSKEEYTHNDRLEVAKMGDEVFNKVGLMDYYIERGNFNQADSVLHSVENDRKYEEYLHLIEDFGNYIDFRSNLANNNRNLAQLDSSEISYLETLAENEGRVAGYAKNILCFFYDICYEEEFAFGGPQTKTMLKPINNQAELNDILYNVKLYPNPANDYTSLQWEIYDELKDVRYSVVDLNGRELLSGFLSGNKGEQVIDTRKLSQGVYIIGIYNNNEMKVNRKLVVVDER